MNFNQEQLVKSPLNYTGGKFKLLPQILPLFPDNINTFVDLFGGGCNVGVNSNAKKIYYNEKQSEIVDLFQNLYKHSVEETLTLVNDTISKFNNIATKEDYWALRDSYNTDKVWYKLFVLSCYSFNFSLRFNKSGGFNMTSGVGSSYFNDSIKERLIKYIDFIKIKDIEFLNKDFREVDILDTLGENDFVYLDPPYLISIANYNENGGWGEKDEKDLLSLLDKLNDKGVKFALSNVIVHKGQENNLLIEWARKYNIYMLQMKYNASWNAGKKKENNVKETIEVVVTNYIAQ